MKKFNRPDLNAPRFRPTKLNLTNKDFLNRFLQENPKYAGLTVEQFKEIITTFNGLIWQNVIDRRDGVELPEQLGYLFIGTCPRRKKESVDYKKSSEYGTRIQNQNWESDHYMAKIFYTNFETKYKFRNNELWGFVGVRDFKREVAHTYPTEWKKYVMVDNLLKVSRLFRIEKERMTEKETVEELMKNYDEFNLD